MAQPVFAELGKISKGLAHARQVVKLLIHHGVVFSLTGKAAGSSPSLISADEWATSLQAKVMPYMAYFLQAHATQGGQFAMSTTTLTLSSKNYSSWSMRGWLMLKMSGLPFTEVMVESDSAIARAELLLLSPSILVPCLNHGRVKVWDTLAIGEYLNEIAPKAGLLPSNSVRRAHCRAVCGEMHSGFSAMRASLPMNIKAQFKGFKVWAKAKSDLERILEIWTDCLKAYKGPYLFGQKATLADAMFAPVVTRLRTYGVSLDPVCEAYCQEILKMPAVQEWIEAAKAEPEDIVELEVEF